VTCPPTKDKKFRDSLIAEEAKVALNFAKKAGIECTPEELKEISGGWTFPKPGDLRSKK
jgi:hypothetical protein